MNAYCHASKLKNIQNNLEKSEKVLLDNLSKYEENLDLIDTAKEFSIQHKREETELLTQIKEIMQSVKCIKITVCNNVNGTNAMDVQQLKNEMVSIQMNIQNIQFKAKTQLEFLKQEETVLMDEVENFEQKLHDWTKPMKYFTSHKFQKSASAKPCYTISKEVEEFMNFIATNKGHENGWSTDDHQLFLKMRQKFTAPEKMAINLHTLLADISIEEILAHERWYVKYNELKTKYRTVISDWRKTKSATLSSTNQKENSMRYGQNKTIYTRKEIKKKLEEWNAEKQEAALRQKEYELQKKVKEKEMLYLQKQKNEDVKNVVNRWKYSKLISDQEEKLQKEMKELETKQQKVAEARKMIKFYQLQDQQYIQKMKQNYLQKSRNKIIIRKNDKTIRDPQRVLKPTKQWLSRIKKVNTGSELKSNLDLTTIPKLATPHWRQSVS